MFQIPPISFSLPNELEGHYSFLFGRRDDEGSPFCYGTENMGKDEFVSDYFQGLELLVHALYFDTSEELHKNDELCAQVQVNDEKIKEQEEKTKELEEKFKAQEYLLRGIFRIVQAIFSLFWLLLSTFLREMVKYLL